MLPTELITELDRFTAFDAAEEAGRQETLAWLRSTQHNPVDRTVYTPGHATGSAIIIADDTKEILLLLHGKLNRWVQPGGHAEHGDVSLPATALREAQEETGVVLAPSIELFDIDAHRVPPFRDTPSHIHFDFRYLFRTTHATPRRSAESGDVQWFSRATLPNLDGDGGVTRIIAKCIARGLL